MSHKTMIKVNGQMVSLWDEAQRRGLHCETVRQRWKKMGRPVLVDEDVLFRSAREGTTGRPVGAVSNKPSASRRCGPGHIPPVKVDPEDRSPGWLERREFPRAGTTGFGGRGDRPAFCGSTSVGVSVYSGSRN